MRVTALNLLTEQHTFLYWYFAQTSHRRNTDANRFTCTDATIKATDAASTVGITRLGSVRLVNILILPDTTYFTAASR